MRTVRTALFAFLAIGIASTALAQYGLYGSPETVLLPQPQASPYATPAYPTPTYATPSNYPTTATPAVASVPSQTSYQAPAFCQPPALPYAPGTTQAYAPAQPQYGAAAQPRYGYPAQRPAAAAYQPYQAGSQYRYPSPAVRAPVRTAAVQPATPLQPIPAPSAVPTTSNLTPETLPAPQGSGIMNQMLSEQPDDACNGGCGVYGGAVGQYEQAACGAMAGGCYGDVGCGEGYCPWYASVSALILGRSDGRRVWTSYEDGHEEVQLTNSDFSMPWRWGGEVRLGRRFCCACTPYAIEGAFWTTESFLGTQTTSLYPDAYVSTPLNITHIYFDLPGGTTYATALFTGAQSHTLERRDEVYNCEINLIREQLAWAYDSPWDIGWSVGVRYFRFQDSLMFSSVSNLGDYEAYFKDTTTNNLIGAQFGFDAAYNVGRGIRLFITPKVGIYDNLLDGDFSAKARPTGGDYVDGNVDVTGYSNFPVHGTGNGIAFLTQIDLGADWQFSRNWSVRAGYRVVAVSGIGTADDQFPQYLCDTPDIRNIQHTSSLILHGAFAGLTYNF